MYFGSEDLPSAQSGPKHRDGAASRGVLAPLAGENPRLPRREAWEWRGRNSRSCLILKDIVVLFWFPFGRADAWSVGPALQGPWLSSPLCRWHRFLPCLGVPESYSPFSAGLGLRRDSGSPVEPYVNSLGYRLGTSVSSRKSRAGERPIGAFGSHPARCRGSARFSGRAGLSSIGT